MRLRNKPAALEKLKNNPTLVVLEPEAWCGKWQQLFVEEQPLHIEVGSGKGRFINDIARQHPEINYIGIDLQASVLVNALDQLLAEPLPNLRLLQANGNSLTSYFAPSEVARIYLNFSDPWPKKKHTKRRLTAPAFLAAYSVILSPDGAVHFKTDNQQLFEYSLCSFSQSGWFLQDVSLDLHHSDKYPDNIMTEYEEKFAARGNRIYRLEASRKHAL